MSRESDYKTKKDLFLKNKTICIENRELFKEFLETQEYKLKRINGLKELDEGCYKTLYTYIFYLTNVNMWFKNKPWKNLTKSDIKKVYDDLEDGKLKGISGKTISYKKDYYAKIFKGRVFELAGKKTLAEEVMEFTSNPARDVRFFEEAVFKKIANATQTLRQRLLCWLAWDFGENIFSLLQLRKKDFVRRIDSQTQEPEYILILRKEVLKRSRTARSEPTIYRETVDLLDNVLPELGDEELLFKFEHRNALDFLKVIRDKLGVKVLQGHDITWKDFRSSMACHLLDIGWTTDEIKARLGHKPSSDVLDVYVNYKALNKRTSKRKVEEGKIRELTTEVEELKHREKLSKRTFEVKVDTIDSKIDAVMKALGESTANEGKISQETLEALKRHFPKSTL